MNETEKDQKLSVFQILVLIILVAIGLFVLFIDVFAAEGMFGLGDDWSHWNSSSVRRVYGIVAAIVVYLVIGSPRRRGNDQSTDKDDQSLEQEPEQKDVLIKRKYSYFVNYLHMAVVLMLLLTIYLRKMGIDGSNGGIDFANIAGGSFLILLFVAAGLHMFRFRPQWRGSPIIYKIFVVALVLGGLLMKIKSGL